MPPRRVLLYSDGAAFSGGERYLLELARGLPRDRYLPTVVASEEGAVDGFVAEARELGVEVDRLPAITTLKAKGPLLKVVRYFAGHRPEILHFNLVDPRACNGAMVAASFALRRRFVVTEHLPASPFDDRPLPMRHRIARRTTALTIVNSEDLRQVVAKRPKQWGRIAVVPNGISDPGAGSAARRAAARTALRLPADERLVVGWLGRLVPQKLPELFLEGVRRVAAVRPDVHFAVLGDGPLFGALESKMRALGLAGRLTFHGHRTDARELLFAFDLAVNTSRYEGQPFALLEAMMAGIATLAPRIPGMAELVLEGVNGRLFAPEDGDSLGAAMHAMLADPAALHRMGRVARERALVLHTSEAMGRATAALYDGVVDEPSPTA